VAWPREIRVRYLVFTYTEAKGLWGRSGGMRLS
jgi:hypothetical protein